MSKRFARMSAASTPPSLPDKQANDTHVEPPVAEVLKPILSPETDTDIKTPSEISTKTPSEISPPVTGNTVHFADAVRRAIRWPGKENSPLRVTEPELARLKAAVRRYEDKGYFTDRTQIIRASVCYILDDLDKNGDQSVLDVIMDRINNY